MKKTMRKVAITAASALLTFSVGALIVENKNVFVASAETVAVEQNFTMQDGASIRIMSNTPSGIRWSVNVSQAYYEYVQSAAADSSFEFGTYVDETPIEISEGNIVNTTAIKIPCTTSQTPEFDEKTGVWTYNASILYSELAEEIRNKLAEKGITDETVVEQKVAAGLQEAYETVLYARGYVKIGNEYEYAVEADTGRSVRGVAMHCLIENTSDVTSSNRTSFETYAGGTYTVEATEMFGGENAYSLTEKAGTITSANELTAGDYTVYAGAKKVADVTLSANGKISATVKDLGATAYEMGKEYKLNFINSDNEVYQVPFLVATHVISTKQQYIDYMNGWSGGSDSGAKTEKNQTADNYVVLTDNIDLGGTTFKKQQTDFFAGKFDGLGHTLSNVKVTVGSTSGGGLFGYISSTGVVKNVAIVDISCDNTWQYLISGFVYGKIQNMYVAGEFTVDANKGAIRARNLNSVSNVIVNIKHKGERGEAYNDYTSGKNGIKNSYAIGNAVTFDGSITDNLYKDMASFLKAEASNITATNGWNKYWSLQGDIFSFGDAIINMGGTVNDAIYTSATTFDLSGLTKGEEIATLTLNGAAVAIPENGIYDLSSLTYGKMYELQIITVSSSAITQPIMTATHVISTKQEYIDYMNGWSGAAATNGTADDYVVLTDNIDLDGTTFKKQQSDYFAGKFDGLGHTLSNVKVTVGSTSGGGLFGYIASTGVVKNVAIVDISCDNSWQYVISGRVDGKIQNVYVSCEITVESGNGAIRAFNTNSVSNVIVNIKHNGIGIKGEAFYDYTTNKNGIKNSYAIGNAVTFNGFTTNNLYSDVATFLAAQKANITEANGWNEYWMFDKDGVLYFGDTKVEDAKAE